MPESIRRPGLPFPGKVNRFLPMTDDLTPRQRDVLGFIQAHAGAEGAPPTLQQDAGYLQVRPNEARGMRVVGVPGTRCGLVRAE